VLNRHKRVRVKAPSRREAIVEMFWAAVGNLGRWLSDVADRRMDRREFIDQVKEKWL
jgi:hypothetical protein